MSVKDRMEDLLRSIEEAGEEGVEMRDLVKRYYETWGFRLSTIKGYVYDLEELEGTDRRDKSLPFQCSASKRSGTIDKIIVGMTTLSLFHILYCVWTV